MFGNAFFFSSSRLILDGLNSSAAYSLRKLRTAYTGSAINVRRSSDGATQDIGFTASGDLDTVTLLAFVGTGNGFVTRWYDQSGNLRHATQATATAQPQIVASGAVWTKNGRPALRHLAANSTQLFVSTNYLATDWTINVVQGLDGGANRRMLSGDPNWLLGYWGGLEATYYFSGGPIVGRSATVQNQVYTAGRQGTGQAKVYANGIDITQPTGLSTPPSNLVTSGNQNEFSNGSTQELIVFNTSLSTTERQTLENNQGEYYGISFLALDQISAPAAAAYSLRKLRTAYSGAAIRVRRSSDNTELDIGFTATGELDTTTLLAFVGTGNGFVTTWYDQSGNGRNATKTTASIQPQIVSSGTLFTENGRPYINFAVNKGLGISSNAALLAFTAAVLKSDSPVFSHYHTIFDGLGGERRGGILEIGQTYFHSSVFPTAVRKNGTALVNPFNLAPITTPFQVSIQNTGGFVGTACIGNYDNGSIGGAAKQSEAIVFSAVPSTTDRQTIERNQGQYYGITII